MAVAGQAVNNKDDVLKGKGMELQCVCVCVCVCVCTWGVDILFLSFSLISTATAACPAAFLASFLVEALMGGEGSENKHLPNNEKN